MIVIDWTPNGQGGFFANVLLDETNGERWVWNGADDKYDLLEPPQEKHDGYSKTSVRTRISSILSKYRDDGIAKPLDAIMKLIDPLFDKGSK